MGDVFQSAKSAAPLQGGPAKKSVHVDLEATLRKLKEATGTGTLMRGNGGEAPKPAEPKPQQPVPKQPSEAPKAEPQKRTMTLNEALEHAKKLGLSSAAAELYERIADKTAAQHEKAERLKDAGFIYSMVGRNADAVRIAQALEGMNEHYYAGRIYANMEETRDRARAIATKLCELGKIDEARKIFLDTGDIDRATKLFKAPSASG